MKRPVAIVCIFSVCLSLLLFFPSSPWHATPSPVEDAAPRPKNFPRKIWQTWQGTKKLEDEPLRLARTWVELNAGYGYELLTDMTAMDYIRRAFLDDADLLDTWARIDDYILRADLIRYLAMLGDGGIYADMDTDCTKPISDWLSSDLEEAAEVVVGIEFDERADPLPKDLAEAAQFCSWTIMSKPGSKHMQHVVETTLQKLRGAMHEGSIRADNASEVLRLTGPRGFTDSLFESMAQETGLPMSSMNVSRLTKPKLIGSVLVMPISSFASGQEHEGSMPWGNEQQLLSHHWSGFHTWKVDYQS